MAGGGGEKLRSREERKIRRYETLRRICRLLNQNRRQMRQKIDLLCGDLVDSNKQLTESLQQLRRAYHFQSGLIGQYDLHYLLCCSLQQIRQELPDSGAAVYLCQSSAFEAHLTRSGNSDDDPDQIEADLYLTTIRSILRNGQPKIIANINRLSTPVSTNGAFQELSVLGLPLADGSELIGAMIFYREVNSEYKHEDRRKIQPYLPPLSRAIAGLAKLEGVINSLKE
jgi:transcriptional regulator with GAF, ATPase, and Fis domain